MIKKSGIYKIINKINKKFYIGSAVDLKKRWNSHRGLLNNNSHPNQYLQNAWNKYGENNFSFEVIKEVKNKEELLDIEQIWLDKTECYEGNIGYNICKIAKRPISDITMTQEVRKKFSEANMGRFVGEKSYMSKLTWQQVREIRHMYFNNNELSCAKIAKMFNVGTSNIKQIIAFKTWKENKNQYDIKNRKKRIHFTFENAKKIRKDYKENEFITISEIARKYGVSRACIQAIIENRNFIDPNYTVFTRGYAKGEVHKNSKLTWGQVREIRRRYEKESIPQRQLAREYDICPRTLIAVLNNQTWKEEN